MARPGVDDRFRAAMRAAGRARSVFVGQAVADPELAIRLTLPDLLTHALVLGAAGSGKTRLVSIIVMFVLREIARAPDRLGLVLGDFKSEFAELVRDLLADLLETLPSREANAIIDRFVVLNPFSTTSLVPMQLMARDPTIAAEIQAAELTTVVERLGGAPLGVKQDSFTYAILLLGILEGLNMLDIRHLVGDLPVLEAKARESSSIEVREILGNASRLAKSSLDGVRARLDRLLRLPSMRLMLGAKTCTPFRELVNERILVADVGSPPLGCSDIGAFWTNFIMLKLTRAIFERSHADAMRPVLVMIDEWQQGLAAGAEVVEQFEHVLAMARSRGVHLWMISQSMAGAAKVSASLPEVVATNTTLQFLGRASIKDARTMNHLLPATGRCPRPRDAPWEEGRRSPFLASAEERELLVARVANLEGRCFYLWDRRRPYRAELIRAASIEPDGMTFRGASLSQRLRDGVLGVPIDDLEQEVKAAFNARRAPGAEFERARMLVGAPRRPN